MISDTVQVPVSLMIFLGGIIVSFLGAMLSFSGHLLIAIRTSLAKLVVEMAVHGQKVDGRLSVLERHDTANEEDRRHLQRHAALQGGSDQ